MWQERILERDNWYIVQTKQTRRNTSKLTLNVFSSNIYFLEWLLTLNIKHEMRKSTNLAYQILASIVDMFHLNQFREKQRIVLLKWSCTIVAINVDTSKTLQKILKFFISSFLWFFNFFLKRKAKLCHLNILVS